MRIQVSFIAAGCVAAAVAPRAAAQETLFSYRDSNQTGAQVVAGLGDVDGDGRPDFAIGAPARGQNLEGAVDVRSGASGALIYTLTNPDAGMHLFGARLRALGDLDGDGVRELYVGASDPNGSFPFAGYVHSGRTGVRLLGRFDGGDLVEACGDVDGDGLPDFLVSYPQSSPKIDHPAAVVRSGRDARVLAKVRGSGFFTQQIAGLDDVDGDGHADFLVADPEARNAQGNRNAGVVQILSGADRHELLRLEGKSQDASLGYVANRVEDRDGDGRADFVIADYDGFAASGNLAMHVVSSATGRTLLDLHNEGDWDPLGYRVVDPGDVDGDGVRDFAIGALLNAPTAQVRIHSGRTGAPLFKFFGLEGHVTAGGDLDAIGDVDGDGRADLLAGETDAGAGGTLVDYVRVSSGNDLWLATSSDQAFPGSTVVLTTREGTPGELTVTVLTEFGGAPTFRLIGGLGIFDATGSRFVSDLVPPGLNGLDAKVRAFALDANGRTIDSAELVLQLR